MSERRIGYLTAEYPKVSHTFIAREVAALRRAGVEVCTFSVRRTPEARLYSDDDRRAAEETFAILPVAPGRLLRAHARALRRHPLAYAATLVRALRLSAGGLRAGLWQLFYFAEAMLLWDECRRREVAHVHAHFANVASAVAMLLAEYGRADGMTWSFTMHGPTEFDDVTRFALAQKIDSAAFVACISDYCRSQLMKLVEPAQWPKLRVVRCGLETAPEPAVRGTGATPGVGPADPADPDPADSAPLRILSVGRMVPDKGQALLLDAVAELDRRGVDVRLTLVGDGPDRPRLQDAVGRLGLAHRVTLPGALAHPQVADLYDRADVFCLPSFAEGLPVVLMEAMSHGVPVVATRVAGVAELVQDGVSGALVSAGRVDALVDALTRLAGDRALRSRLGAAGRARVRAEYDVNDSAQTLAGLFAAAPAGVGAGAA